MVTFIIDNDVYLIQIVKKDSVVEPEVPEEEGKTLNGWYTDDDLENKFNFGTRVTESSLTLYVVWEGPEEDNYSWLWLLAFLILLLLIPIALTKKVEFYLNEDYETTYAIVNSMSKQLGDKLPQIRKEDFVEWYAMIDGKEMVINENTQIKDRMKVFAKWK